MPERAGPSALLLILDAGQLTNRLNARAGGACQFAFPEATFFGRDEDGEYKDKLNDYRVVGTFTLVFLASVVYVGISYISKFAVLFLSGVLMAIFSIFLGASREGGGRGRRRRLAGVRAPRSGSVEASLCKNCACK